MKNNPLKKNPQVVTRKIENETLLIPIFNTAGNKKYIYSLNQDASYMWDLIDERRTFKNILKIITEKHSLSEKEIKTVKTCIQDLQKIKAIV